MPHADVNGQHLYYEDTGGDGPPVVFSHGLFMDHTMFAPQIEALKDRYRCISWDQRGHGDTGEVSEPFTYWDSAEDLRQLLDSLGVRRAVLAGMSQGGFLSLRAALTHLELVRGLILIDTQAGVEDPERLPYYQALLERWNSQGMDDELAETIATIILGQGWEGSGPWKQKWHRLQIGTVNQLFATLAGRDDIHDRLPELGVPALVIHGEQDMAISLDLAHRLCDELPIAELRIIPGAGHASNMTNPELVTPQIERFLAGFED
jgi:pimeloyl-ACP methyl ester carboxylesterase